MGGQKDYSDWPIKHFPCREDYINRHASSFCDEDETLVATIERKGDCPAKPRRRSRPFCMNEGYRVSSTLPNVYKTVIGSNPIPLI